MSGDSSPAEPVDDVLEDVLRYVRSETELEHLVQYAARRGYIPAGPPVDAVIKVGQLRADAAAESLEKLAGWAWAQDGRLAGTAFEIIENAQKTATFLRKFGDCGDPMTATDADRTAAVQLLRDAAADKLIQSTEPHKQPEMVERVAAALADARAEADQLRDAMRALAKEWEREDDWNEIAPSTAAARVRDLADGGRR